MNPLIIKTPPSLAWQVKDNLFIGNIPHPDSDLKGIFDVLVLTAEEYQPNPMNFRPLEVVAVSLMDNYEFMDEYEKEDSLFASNVVEKCLRNNKKVLVTCHAGRNRSGLVCALSLCKRWGMGAEEAINTVRGARGPSALENPQYQQFIYFWDKFRKNK